MSIAVWIRNDTDKKVVEEFDCLFCQEGNHHSECPVELWSSLVFEKIAFKRQPC
jgi:uncharacterized protein YjhX (UPF0386 family)